MKRTQPNRKLDIAEVDWDNVPTRGNPNLWAEIIYISNVTVLNACKDGNLKHTKIGAQYLIERDDIKSWLRTKNTRIKYSKQSIPDNLQQFLNQGLTIGRVSKNTWVCLNTYRPPKAVRENRINWKAVPELMSPRMLLEALWGEDMKSNLHYWLESGLAHEKVKKLTIIRKPDLMRWCRVDPEIGVFFGYEEEYSTEKHREGYGPRGGDPKVTRWEDA